MSMDGPFYITYVGLWALVVFQSLVLIGLVRAVQELKSARVGGGGGTLDRLDDNALRNAPIPEFAATDLDGRTVTSTSLIGAERTMLFVSPDCSSCAATLKDVHALNRRSRGNLVIVCLSPEERCSALAEHYRLDVPVIVDSDRALTNLFHVSVPPTAIKIRPDGIIDSYGHPMSADDLTRDQISVQNGGDPGGVLTDADREQIVRLAVSHQKAAIKDGRSPMLDAGTTREEAT